MRMPSRQKTKGNAFEKEVAKFLNEQHNTTEFHRTPSSGAFLGRDNFERKGGLAEHVKDALVGDLITPLDYPFVVECKSYKDKPSFYAVLNGADSTLTKWLKEVEVDADHINKQPILFFKITNKGTYYVVPAKIVDSMMLSEDGRWQHFERNRIEYIIEDGVYPHRKYIIYNLKYYSDQKTFLVEHAAHFNKQTGRSTAEKAVEGEIIQDASLRIQM